MPSPDEHDDDLVGRTIAGRYRIISQLGAGGMGTAYRAWDEQADVPVVIKIPRRSLLEEPKFAERFRREIRLLQGLVHPHIVPIVDDGEHEGLPFVVMRFLPGGSLSNRRLRDESGKVSQNPPGFLHLWLPAVADALDAIHASGVVHRDVKPANIFFDAGWGAFVGDFGIAKIVAESDVFDRERTLTATHMGIGTPDYMAPEQFAPKAVIDGRADQYALAVIVYEMLAGARPFTGETANLIVEIMTEPAPRLDRTRSDLPSSLVAAVDRGLSKRPEERFATCREFAAAVLRDVPRLDDEPGVARLLCPKCASLLKLPESAAGRKGKCPKCKTEMKVADDLGAMWLLDEAGRQEDAVILGGITGNRAVRSGVPSLEDFRLVSAGKPARRTPGRSGRKTPGRTSVQWLIAGAALAGAAMIPWLLPDGKNAVRKSAEDKGGSLARSDARKPAEPPAERRADSAKSAADVEGSRQPKASPDAPPEEHGIGENMVPRESEPGPLDGLGNPPSAEPEKPQADTLQTSATPTDGSSDQEDRVCALDGLKMPLVLKRIQPGAFMMGSADNDPEVQNAKPVHRVVIAKPFYLGVTEVTNAQWKAVMGPAPGALKEADDLPVVSVSWDEAAEFCEKLSGLAGEKDKRRKYRLPTEAEWEYACRAGTQTRYSCGDPDAALKGHAWFADNSGNIALDATPVWNRNQANFDNLMTQKGCQRHLVKTKRANPWGLHDMHGNVEEWCSDSYAPYGADPGQLVPAQIAERRVCRGGSWKNVAGQCRSAFRMPYSPVMKKDTVGFRVALDVPEKADNPNP